MASSYLHYQKDGPMPWKENFMRLIPVQSSNITAIAYFPTSSRFYVQFVNGLQWYCYDCLNEDVARQSICDIAFAESPGKVFNIFKQNVLGVKVENPEDFDFHV